MNRRVKKEMFKTIVCKNYDEVSLEAFKVMKGVLDTEVNPILGLATGSTPVGRAGQAHRHPGPCHRKQPGRTVQEHDQGS